MRGMRIFLWISILDGAVAPRPLNVPLSPPGGLEQVQAALTPPPPRLPPHLASQLISVRSSAKQPNNAQPYTCPPCLCNDEMEEKLGLKKRMLCKDRYGEPYDEPGCKVHGIPSGCEWMPFQGACLKLPPTQTPSPTTTMDPKFASPAGAPGAAPAPAPTEEAEEAEEGEEEGEDEEKGSCGADGTPCPTTPPETTTPDPWPGCEPCPCTKAPFGNFPAMEVQAHYAQEKGDWAAYDLCRLKHSLAHLYPDAPECFPPTEPPTTLPPCPPGCARADNSTLACYPTTLPPDTTGMPETTTEEPTTSFEMTTTTVEETTTPKKKKKKKKKKTTTTTTTTTTMAPTPEAPMAAPAPAPVYAPAPMPAGLPPGWSPMAAPGASPSAAEQAFAAADANGDGTLSVKEFQAVHGGVGTLPPAGLLSIAHKEARGLPKGFHLRGR